MTVSPNKQITGTRVIVAVMLAAVISIVFAAPVNAQPSLQPKSITPKTLAPLSEAEPLEKPTLQPGQVEGTAPSAGGQLGRLGGAISIESLQTIDPDSVGTMTREEGGFGINMWDGTSRDMVEKLLPKLPVNSQSRTMRDMMRRLLLSIAKAPPQNLKSGAGATGNSIIAMRIERLAAMGDVAGVEALLKVAPNKSQNVALLKSEADVLFLSNDNARACPLVAGQISNVDTAYWHKAFIFCQSLAGEHDKAALGVELLKEQEENDPVFFGLIDQLAGIEKFAIESMVNPQPLHFAMVRAAKAKLPRDVTSTNNPAVLKTIATSPNANPGIRVDAAERAEAMGALNTEVLMQLYAGVTFTEQVLDSSLSRADSERNPLSRALLYRKALVESVPTATAEVLARALRLARDGGRYQSLARVYHRILSRVAPTQDLLWFAPEAARALLAAGDGEGAQKWFSILRSSAIFEEKVAMLRNQLMPLARLTGVLPDEEWKVDQLHDWWLAQINPKTKDGDERPVNMEAVIARGALLYNLLEAFGDRVPDENWSPLLDGPPHISTVIPQPALWRSLANAADQVNVGETILLSLLTLGQAGPTQVDPTVLRQVVSSLQAIGLDDEARALALEAAVAAGL